MNRYGWRREEKKKKKRKEEEEAAREREENEIAGVSPSSRDLWKRELLFAIVALSIVQISAVWALGPGLHSSISLRGRRFEI